MSAVVVGNEYFRVLAKPDLTGDYCRTSEEVDARK